MRLWTLPLLVWGNGLSPVRHQAPERHLCGTWTNTDLLSCTPLWTNLSDQNTHIFFRTNYSGVPLWRSPISHYIPYHITRRAAEQKWDLNSQKAPHTSPSRARYGAPIVRIWEKIDRVITAPHYNLNIASAKRRPFCSGIVMSRVCPWTMSIKK